VDYGVGSSTSGVVFMVASLLVHVDGEEGVVGDPGVVDASLVAAPRSSPGGLFWW
jgi:hypothetical protein